MIRIILAALVSCVIGLTALITAAEPPAKEPPKEPAAEKPKAKTITGTFAIEFAGMDGEKTQDELTFDSGNVFSKFYLAGGFAQAKVSGNGTSFTAVMENVGRGANVTWSGSVKDDAISGTMLLNFRGEKEQFTFSGTLKK